MNYETFTPSMDVEIPELDEIDVDQYFTKEELVMIGDYEKLRYKNMVRNYLTMMCFGLPVAKPEFMKGPRRKTKPMMPVDSDSEEEDWTPSLARKKEKEKLPPAPFKFVPPKKPIFVKKKVKDINKTKPVAERKVVKAKGKAKSSKECPATVSRPPPEADVTVSAKNMIMRAAAPRSENSTCKKQEETECSTEARYPKRSVQRKNYKELEVPDEDIFLFCEDCQKEYPGDCPVHGPLTIIKDKEVPQAKRSDPDHARKTAPEGLVIESSKIRGAGLGVISNIAIPEGVRFGPYGGEIVYEMDPAVDASGYAWEIYKDNKSHHYIEAKNPAKSNWMRYCNCARNESEQNLIAFQYQGEIYYKTIQIVYPGQELLVFYGEGYAHELGIDKKTETLKGMYPKPITLSATGAPEYRCPFCILSMAYKIPNVLMSHVAKKHLEAEPTDVKELIDNLYRQQATYEKERAREMRQKMESLDSDLKLSNCRINSEVTAKSVNLNKNVQTHTGDKPYKCDLCGKGFNRSDSLQRHMRIHTGDKPYKCDHCGKGCNSRSDLKKHMRIHTGEKPYKCDHCGKGFNVSSNLQIHMRIHTGDKPYKCDQCGKGFIQNGDLQKHMRMHTGEKPYKCDLCGKGFNRTDSLQRHMRIHTGDKPYKCDQCGKGFNVSTNLQTHMRIHTGDKPYKCDQCGKGFNVSSNLQIHMRIHTGDKPYKCDQCGKGFIQNGDRQKHMRMHTGEKPYKCDHCGKGFNQSCHLQTHKMIHTGDKPFKCDHCGKGFNVSTNLQTHMRIHTGDKPYKCDLCGKGFSDNSALHRHMRIHTGEKPYTCDQCEERFAQHTSLEYHVKNHHDEKHRTIEPKNENEQ